MASVWLRISLNVTAAPPRVGSLHRAPPLLLIIPEHQGGLHVGKGRVPAHCGAGRRTAPKGDVEKFCVVIVRDPRARPSRCGCFEERSTSAPRRWSRPGETLLGDVYRHKVILARVLPPTLLATPSPPGGRRCRS